LLAARFWPGPLTLVVNKAANVPICRQRAGRPLACACPAHPVALDLLRQAGVPIAAPSANRSEEVSPTTAQHVADSLDPFVDDLLVLDGGPTEVGIESTVLDVSVWPPRLLRLGMVTVPMLRELTGRIVPGQGPTDAPAAPRSPGLMTRHYAPTKPLLIVWPDRLDNVLRSGDGLWCLPAHTPARCHRVWSPLPLRPCRRVRAPSVRKVESDGRRT
jgi:L-threonylcarbamoyladenylate synthase